MMCEVSSFQEYRHREEMEGVRMVVGKEGRANETNSVAPAN